MDRKAFTQALAAGKIGGAYLFEGPEENIKAAALAELRRRLLPEGLEELNETVLEAPSADEVIAAAETLPFLAEKRLVIVRELPGLTGRGEGDERLRDYLAHVPDTTALVFVVPGKADARKKLYTAVKKYGNIVSFDPLNDAELNDWIRRTFAALGKTCDPRTASLLAFTVGGGTALMRREIEKLAALCGDRPAVTDEDVRRAATRSMECRVFDLVDAVVAGDEGRALRMTRDMLTAGEERLGILAMLLRQYRLIRQVKILQYEKNPPQAVKNGLGVAPFAADKCVRQAAAYSGRQAREAVAICLDTEMAVKSGRINDEGALETAILKLLALRERPARRFE